MITDRIRHQRTKLIKLSIQNEVECVEVCSAVGVSSGFFSILRACYLFLHGKDDKGDKLCRAAVKELNEVESHDMMYELTSVVQAYVQESIQLTSQKKKLLLFEQLPDSV